MGHFWPVGGPYQSCPNTPPPNSITGEERSDRRGGRLSAADKSPINSFIIIICMLTLKSADL